jgi:hypothetical protein
MDSKRMAATPSLVPSIIARANRRGRKYRPPLFTERHNRARAPGTLLGLRSMVLIVTAGNPATTRHNFANRYSQPPRGSHFLLAEQS